ncbi:MAG: hypothetical protein FJ088_07410, partial [Deltaproteobacteria bacterium]|nr:hypothetical protein [Deltaproteobacteria bacterium]
MKSWIFAVLITALTAACAEKKIEEARKSANMPSEKAGPADASDRPGVLETVEPVKTAETVENRGGEAKKPYLLLSTEQIAGSNEQLIDIINNLKDPKKGKKNKEYFSKLDASDQKRLLNEFLKHSSANVRIQSAQILLLLKKTDRQSIERFI